MRQSDTEPSKWAMERATAILGWYRPRLSAEVAAAIDKGFQAGAEAMQEQVVIHLDAHAADAKGIDNGALFAAARRIEACDTAKLVPREKK